MKTLFIFDFDDTLALTNSHVVVNDSLRLSSRDFAKYRAKPDDKLDFSEFMDVKDGSLIQSTVDAMQKAIDQYGYENVHIVTARSVAAPVEKFLSKMGVTTPEIYAAHGSENKARWLINKLMTKDYQRVVVYEDCKKNIAMLEDVVNTYNEEMNANVAYTPVCVVVLGENRMKLSESQLRMMIRKSILQERETGPKDFFGKVGQLIDTGTWGDDDFDVRKHRHPKLNSIRDDVDNAMKDSDISYTDLRGFLRDLHRTFAVERKVMEILLREEAAKHREINPYGTGNSAVFDEDEELELIGHT